MSFYAMLGVSSRRIPLVALSVSLFLGLATHLRASGVVYDNGASDRANGWEMTQWVEADDFVVEMPTRISGIKFWSNEIPGAFAGSIYWEIYSNAPANRPGALLFSGFSMNVSHIDNAFTIFGPYREFQTTFDIAAANLAPGRYWLALHNGPETNNAPANNFYWAATSKAGIYPSHVRAAGAPGLWFSNQFPGLPADLAFQLRGVPAPRIESIARDTGRVSIRFSTVAGENYRVEYRNDLTMGGWKRLPHSETAGTGGTAEVTHSDDPSISVRSRFYRVVLL